MTEPFVVDLSTCRTATQLANALGIHPDVLAALASPDAATLYRRHAIPKRSGRRKGQTREVFEPDSEELRQVHKTLHRRLTAYASQRDPTFPPPCCYGFVRKRSTLENADQHKGHRLLLRTDIADFFPSISRARVREMLASIGLMDDCAELLSRALCFNGALVPGLSASPLVANLVCRSLDARLLDIAGATGATYTRYADDIAISGERLPELAAIAQALEAEGFRLSENKQRLTKLGQAHFVTGLSIQDPKRPHVPKKMKRRLRQELYFCVKHSTQDHLLRTKQKLGGGINRLDGLVRYVSFIERGTAFDFREAWERLQARDDVWPSVGSDFSKEGRQYFVAVDETILEAKGRRYLALAFALYEDEAAVEKAIAEVRDDYLADPFVPGKRGAIEKSGLHFADAHPHLRATFVERLPTIPMRVLVGLTEINGMENEEKERAYLRVFWWGFLNLCERTDRGRLTLRVEDAPFLSRATLGEFVERAYELKRLVGTRRPATQPELALVDKGFQAIALPDFMLGVLGAYVKTDEAPTASKGAASVERGHFERVRDRFTLIHDLDTGRYYSRRNPFLSNSLDDRSPPVAVVAVDPIPEPQSLDDSEK